MSEDFQVLGRNHQALFTLKAHRGDGMVLLAMNWKNGKPSDDFVGFGIEYQEPGSAEIKPVRNRLAFRDQHNRLQDGLRPSMEAPIQKFRWIHFPTNAELDGDFSYRVTPLFMDNNDRLTAGKSQEVQIELRRETFPGKLNVSFTRGFVSSQAFVDRFTKTGPLSKLLPSKAAQGVKFKPTHPQTKEALEWMGFEARSAIFDLLDQAIADETARVCVVAYDLNERFLIEKLEKLGTRLRIVIDDSEEHGKAESGETQAEEILRESAGSDQVQRQHCRKLQHNKMIIVDGDEVKAVVYGSTNLSWRGFYVQANNAVVVHGAQAIRPALEAFENYWTMGPAKFSRTDSTAWHDLGVDGVEGKVTYSPHGPDNGVLAEIAEDIKTTTSSLFFSLAFLYQTPGVIRDAIREVIDNESLFNYGMSDKPVGGLEITKPDGKRAPVSPAALTQNVPAPFNEEPTGGMGIRLHHKFVVIDFDSPDARVYFGSYNFSNPADQSNGENLVTIKDRRVAVSYMVEAIRLFDTYHFRVAQAEAATARTELALRKPPRAGDEEPWWAPYFGDTIKSRDRELFA